MAKTNETKDAKTTAASEPTIAPPPVVPSPPDSEPSTLADTGEGETVEEVKSTLPAGVQMHDAGVLPYTADRAERIAPDPARPPVGWAGSYRSCGGCGDFLPTGVERCPKCAPARVLPNVVNGGG